MRWPAILRHFTMRLDIDRALAERKAARRNAPTHEPSEMQIAARKGVATKRRQRRERDPLLQASAR